MVKRVSLFLLIAAIFLLQGCVSERGLRKDNVDQPSAFYADSLNGDYANLADSGDIDRNFLWNILYACKSFRDPALSGSKDATVRLNYDGRHTLEVTLLDAGREITKIQLKAKVHKNYLSIKRNLFIVPIPVIFYVYWDNKVLLSTGPGGKLHVNWGHVSFAQVLIAGGNDWRVNKFYRKQKITAKK
jgi:hypothetical protein